MTERHSPITPPPELVQEWQATPPPNPQEFFDYFATQAAQWGADQELEACCEWLHWQNLATHSELIPSLRAARRSKPPSLKEQALADLDTLVGRGRSSDTIRRALEQLPDQATSEND
jgi:hypothetical protein